MNKKGFDPAVRMNTDKKIEVWRDINTFINRVEESYSIFMSITIAFLGVVFTIFSTGVFGKNNLVIQVLVLSVIAIVLSIILAYYTYNLRMVAIARMYAASLERKINDELGESVFAWNCDIVDKYLARKNMINTFLFPFLSVAFFMIVETSLNYFMWILPVRAIVKVLYTLFITASFICCGASFVKNETIRKEEYKL